MKINISAELDPIFETVGLLSVSYDFSEHKKNMISSLSNFGLDGETYYKEELKIFDRYVHTFIKYRVSDPQVDFFFGDGSLQFILMLASLLTENKSWLSSLDGVTDEEMRMEILNISQKVFDNDLKFGEIQTIDEIIQFLDQSQFEEKIKWKLLNIFQYPKKHIAILAQIINNNIPAFQKSEAEAGKLLIKLIDRFSTSLKKQTDTQFLRIKDVFSQDSNVSPTLVFPVAQLMFDNRCFYGLFSNFVLKIYNSASQPKETLLLKLKALSDNSKLQILCSLKISPKYNLEIAEQLGLSAATMSHHMNVLLACGLVRVDKKNGKVYYQLEPENINKFIEELKQVLL